MMVIGSKNRDDETVCKEYLCLFRFDNGRNTIKSYLA